MHRPIYLWSLAVGGAVVVATGFGATLNAQISVPSLGGGGVGVPGGGIGPGVGPNVGPVNPAVPNVPGVGGVNPGGVVPNGPKNVVPNPVDRATNAANNAVNKNNVGNGNLVGPNVPLMISGTRDAQNLTPLGATIDSRNGRLIVKQVQDGSLLSAAGVQSGDQLLAVNRQWVRSMGDLSNQLSAVAQSEGTATLYLDRNGTKQWLNVDFNSNTRPALGIQMQDGQGSVTIDAVTVNSAAAEAGLQAGDRIIAINGRSVQAAADVAAQVAAAAGANGEINLQIVRDGVEQTLHATLRQARGTVDNLNNQVGATVGNVRQTVGDLRSDVQQLASNVNDQVRNDVERVKTLADNLEQRVADVRDDASQIAQDRVQQVRDDVEQLRTSLAAIVDRTQGTAREAAQNALNRVNGLQQRLQGTAQNTIANVRDRARQSIDSVRDRTGQLRDRLAQIAEQSEAKVQDQVGHVRDRVAALHDRIAQLGGNAQELTRQQVDNLRDEAAAVKSRIDDVADRVNENVRGELHEVRDEVAGLRHDLRDLVNAQVEATGQAAAEFQARVTSDVQSIATDLTTISGQVQGDAQAELQLAAQAAAQLRDDLNGLNNGGADFGDRIASVRERITDLRGRLSDAVDRDGDGIELDDQAHERLENLRDRLAIDRDRLAELRDRINLRDPQGTPGDIARNAVERTTGLRADMVRQADSIRERLNDVNAVENLRDNNGQNVIQDVHARLAGVREKLSDGGDDENRLTALRDDAAALRARAADFARNVADKGDDADSMHNLRARLRTLADDLNDYVAERQYGAPFASQAAGNVPVQTR